MPSRAKAVPSYAALAPEPLVNEPPWIHTKTGSPAAGGSAAERPAAAGSGVQTFRFRQSSPGMVISGSSGRTGAEYSPFGTVGPYAVASRTPVHGDTGCGARSRLRPNGGAA